MLTALIPVRRPEKNQNPEDGIRNIMKRNSGEWHPERREKKISKPVKGVMWFCNTAIAAKETAMLH